MHRHWPERPACSTLALMYHGLLANRYLTTRAIPLIAVAAVALCVALVIIVVSVMTGFLEMVRSSGKTLIGDVVISHSITGVPYYPELIDRLNDMDEVAAATPVVESWGLVKMPYPDEGNKQVQTVQIWGIEPESFAEVTGFADAIYWKPLTEQQQREAREDDFRRKLSRDVFEQGRTLTASDGRPGIVMGLHVSEGNERQPDGSYEPLRNGYWWMPRFEVTVTTIPIGTEGGLSDPESFIFPVVNEFSSGVFMIDDTRVMIPIDRAQEMMRLDEAEIVDPEDFDVTLGVDPARATMILIRAVDGVDPLTLRKAVDEVYDEFVMDKFRDRDAIVKPYERYDAEQGFGRVAVQTWEEQQARFIAPIEKERELMRVLFSIIYLVCAGLILAIFWAIVYEKTRDIGILRSIGASRIGITWIFLRYGLFVGVLGSIVGLGIAYVVIANINSIHNAMGSAAPDWLKGTAFALSALCLIVAIVRSFVGLMLPVVLWVLGALALLGAAQVVLGKELGGLVVTFKCHDAKYYRVFWVFSTPAAELQVSRGRPMSNVQA